MTRRARGVVLRCAGAKLCDFHRDGGAPATKCPGCCDWQDCTAAGYYEVGVERVMCAAHGGLVLTARALKEALAADDAEGGA